MTPDPAPQSSDTAPAAPATPEPPTPFHDPERYVALPRVGGLALSPDGTRLVTTVATLDDKRVKYASALWEVDPTGARPARRLTRSRHGEAGATFTSAGDLLFTSARPDPDGTEADDAPSALWLLPADGAEARVVASRPGGVGSPVTATDAPVVVVTSDVLPHARDAAHDDELRASRTEKKVAAILHSSYPVRYWDHDLGPAAPHLFTGTVGDDLVAPVAGEPEPRLELRDVTPDAGPALREGSAALSPDGATLVASWSQPQARAVLRSVLVAIDVATGERRVLVDDPGADLAAPVISPDGAWVAYERETITTPEEAPRRRLAVVPLAGGEPRELGSDWDRWPHGARWLPDVSGLVVVADDDGRAPVFRLDLATGSATRVTRDAAAFSDLQVAPDGTAVFALRSSYLEPPHPVRIDLAAAADGPVEAVALPGPAPLPGLPGLLTEIETTAADGSRVRAWLAVPDGSGAPGTGVTDDGDGAGASGPAPLLLWIHGGPLGSWNAWSWRWNPWLLVAEGYAVLLPDPALSTGYGQDFVQRGWGRWGADPYTDLLAITDVACARPDVDETRTAAMGGSFGGYMANWVAGHTDRFRAVVTHASLWALDQFGPTTDAAYFWAREMTEAMARENSPHRFVESIVTPMLVIHGDKDYRVPIGEGLRLWYDLLTRSGLPADDEGRTPHRFLYFPDENHWVLTPQHAIVWYRVVSAFLAEHLLGEQRPLPEVLG